MPVNPYFCYCLPLLLEFTGGKCS